jgi:hypothetical protein
MTEPIDLYFWPTPNGFKITIALEEMGLPYRVKLVNINAGEQFEADFLKIAPNNRMPAIVDPEGPDGEADLGLRIRRDPAIPGAQDRQVHRPDRARPGGRGRVADVADGRRGADGGAGASLPQLRAQLRSAAGPALCQGSLPPRGGAAIRRARPAAGEEPLRRRRFPVHRRFRHLALGAALAPAGADDRRQAEHGALARRIGGAAGLRKGKDVGKDVRKTKTPDRKAQEVLFGFKSSAA